MRLSLKDTNYWFIIAKHSKDFAHFPPKNQAEISFYYLVLSWFIWIFSHKNSTILIIHKKLFVIWFKSHHYAFPKRPQLNQRGTIKNPLYKRAQKNWTWSEDRIVSCKPETLQQKLHKILLAKMWNFRFFYWFYFSIF